MTLRLALVIAIMFVGPTWPMGPAPSPPQWCDPNPGTPSPGLPGEFYNEHLGSGMTSFCPAHTVNSLNFLRQGSSLFCATTVGLEVVVPPVNCSIYSNANYNSSATTTLAPNCNVTGNTTTVSMTTTPKNTSYFSTWFAYGWNCIPATCLPPCMNGATCYCGLTCRCKCPTGFTGADCSIDTSTIPNFASAKVLYAFADPHYIYKPSISNYPFLMDLTGNGFDGEIKGWTALDARSGPYARKYSSFLFGANPLNPGYVQISDPSYDLTQLALNPGSSKYTISAYYRPFNQDNNETILFHFGKSGTTPGATIASNLDGPSYYYQDQGTSTYKDINGNSWTTPLTNTSFSLLHFELDQPGLGFNYETGSNAYKNVPLGTMSAANNKGFYIGKNTNPTGIAEPIEVHIRGSIASLLISNTTGLGTAHVAAHQAFSTTNFGTGTSPLDRDRITTPCPITPTSQAMPTRLLVNSSIGESIDFICPPFFTHAVLSVDSNNLIIVIPGVRVDTSVCSAGGWNVTMWCISDPAPIFCDPICINGGTCMCTTTACSCQCWPGFTGPDCFAPTSAIPGNFLAFWPITQETLAGDQSGNLLASDFSNNGMSIIAQNMGFDYGPWDAVNTAARQHYLRALSYMHMTSPFVLSASQDFTILFYIKLPHVANSLPGRASLPLFVYSSPAGSVINTNTGFFLDESIGKIIYYPGGIVLDHVGPPLTSNATKAWVPIKIAYKASGGGQMGTASWDNVPSMTTAVTISSSAALSLFFGYDDVLDRVSDMSVACVGVYNVLYNDPMAWAHGRVCQMFSKIECTSAPYPDTIAVQTGSTLWSAGTITYTCFNGYVWNTTGNMTQSFGCNPNQSILPALHWDLAQVPGVCIKDYACHPTCKNGGACNPGNPPTCNCTAGYIGLDCAIPKNIFPTPCNLVSLWPLSSNSISYDGYLIDIWGPSPATMNRTSIFFPENIGPYAPTGVGVAQFTTSVPGTVQVAPATSPFPSGSSFSVSAFVRFGVTAGTNYSDLYPLITFTNRGVTNSPAIYISPMGNGQFRYKSAKDAYTINFDAGGMFIGIAARWAFVTVQFDVLSNSIAMSVNGSVFGAAVVVNPVPMFSVRKMFIGSVDSGLVWPGEITCLSIWNWVLTTSQIVQLMAACRQILGGTAAPIPSPNCNACTGLNLPAGKFAVLTRNDVVMPFGTVVTYRAPPFTKFNGTINSRSTITTCTATGQWNPLVIDDTLTTGLVTCDPVCMNFGTCVCAAGVCGCVCPTGFTGKDCVIRTEFLPTGAVGFWPLTGDTIDIDTGANQPVALDFSGNGNKLAIGANVALDTGYFGGTQYSALRFRNGQLNSFLKSLVPISGYDPSTPFTILFNMKYNPASDDQPMLAYQYTSQQNSEFWIDQETGTVRYFPDNSLLGLTGLDLGDQPGLQWLPVNIQTSGSMVFGTSTFDSDPTLASSIVGTALNNANLFVGYSNYPTPVTADISINCLGIYPTAYSLTLANTHGKACQIFSKELCPSSPPSPTFSYKNANNVFPNSSYIYYCWSGYYFSSNSAQTFLQSCIQSTNTVQPTMGLTTAPAGSCTASTTTTCYPPCVNGGTCVAGTPTTTCSCPTGFDGTDCSIDITTLPYICKLKSLWPLSTQHIDNNGRAYDLGSQRTPLILSSALRWPPETQIYGVPYGVPAFSFASTGSAKATYSMPPFLSEQSFTISCYVRFDVSAAYSTFYPLVTFTNVWTNPSPAIYLAPNGQMKLLYKYGGSAYTATLSISQFVGMQIWTFVTVRYDFVTGNATVITNGNQIGSTVAITPTPMFSTYSVYVGTSDTNPGSGNQVLQGQMLCVSIYSVALTNSEIAQLKLACDAIIGGPAAPVSTSTPCYTCSEPPAGGLAMQVITNLNFPPGTNATYYAPAYHRYPSSSPPVFNDYRTLWSSCQAGLTWSPPTMPTVDSPFVAPIMCDPECRNGGQCQCTAIGCQCNCMAGYTGVDCVVPTALLTAGVKAFWPMTSESTGRDGFGNLFTYDVTSNAVDLKVGSGVSLVNGPFNGTIPHAYRFRSQVANSLLQSYSSASVGITGSFTIIMYAKYYSTQASHQPLLSWQQPKTQFWINSASGSILYYPSGVTMANTGANYLAATNTWIPLVISYSSSTGKIGSGTYNNAPSVTTGISAPNTAANFYIGYGDSTTPAMSGDISIACVGLYQGVAYSTTLAANHGKACQQASKQMCTSAPVVPMTNAFSSNLIGQIYINENIFYTCIGGYAWNSTSTQAQTLTCSQSTATSYLIPTVAWSASSLTGTCAASTATCYPACLNGGSCVAGSPTAVCSCSTGYAGVDCSVNLATFPYKCMIVSVWPLTSNHVNNAGKAADIMRGSLGGASLPLSTTPFPTNGPFSAITRGIPVLTGTGVGAVQVAAPLRWPALSSFTISAYIRFGVSANYNLMYPVGSYSSSMGLPGSPAFFISPTGAARLYYVSASVGYTIDFNITDPIGLGPWAFVSVIFDNTNNTLSLTAALPNIVSYGSVVTIPYNPVFDSSTAFKIGSSDISPLPSDSVNVFNGQIACVSIYKMALVSSDLTSLLAACKAVLGGPAASTAAQCNMCSSAPSVGLAVRSLNNVLYNPGTSLVMACPAFTRQIDPFGDRSTSVKCLGNETWSPATLPACDYSSSPRMCDPDCLNGGSCICLGSACSCQCLTGFTGIDCVAAVGTVPASAVAFWPLTVDSMLRDPTQSSKPLAADFSGNSRHLTVGIGASLDDGPFGPQSAFKFQSSSTNAYLSLLSSSLPLTTGSAFTILFYVNYGVDALGDQPIMGFSSGGTSFWIDQVSGKILYRPDNVLLPLNGASLTSNPGQWAQAVITFTPAKIIATSSDGAALTSTLTVTTVQLTGTFMIGYADLPTPSMSDLAISCVGIYNGAFSASLSYSHARACQTFAKQSCTLPPPISNAFVSASSIVAGNKVTYTCVGATNYFTSTTSTHVSATCTQASNSLMPALSWTPASFAETCINSSTTCYPTCKNNGVCTNGICVCQLGYNGTDCSINVEILPCRGRLQSWWPLTTNQVNNAGKAIDIWKSGLTAQLSGSAILSADDGPYSPAGFGLLRLTHSAPGALKVTSPNWPTPNNNSTFLISAYVRFDVNSSFTTLYPFVTFTNVSQVTGSPALFISKSGNARMYYESEGQKYWVDFSVPYPYVIGTSTPRSFVRIEYDSITGNISLATLNFETMQLVYGQSVAVSPPPTFSTNAAMYIGSTDMVGLPGTATVFPGEIACLSIYNTTLPDSQNTQILAACWNMFGGPTPLPATQCNVCSAAPSVALAVRSMNSLYYVPGTVLSLTCPAFSRQLAPGADRSATIKCIGNETWVPAVLPQCETTPSSPRMCDPTCLNGGSCICQNSECYCQCATGYTGIDCVAPINAVPSAALSFWPLTVDSLIRDSSQNMTPMAADFSGNSRHLTIGQGAAFDDGPFGSQSAFKFKSSANTSYLSLVSSSLPLSTANAFTIIFYVKYGFDALNAQPILGFSSGSSFWVDQATGKIRYYPDNVNLPLSGVSVVNSPPAWRQVAISFTPVKAFATSTNGAAMPATLTVATVLLSGTLTIGFTNVPAATMSELSISCVGVYNSAFSSSLSYDHAKACQIFAKQSCFGPPPVANAFITSPGTLAGNQLTYTCLGAGSYFNSTNSSTIAATCTQQSASALPTLSWTPSTVTNACTKSNTTCYPTCQNGGNCTSGICVCPTGFNGVDCSLPIEILTCQSHLQSLWPLTTRQINGLGQALDVWSSLTTIPLNTNTIQAADDGPFMPTGFGLLRLTNTAPGTLKVQSPNWPSMSTNGTFLINAYVHFDVNASFTTLYPFVTFANVSGVTGSPALFISKSGNARMYYESGGQKYWVDFSVPTPHVIGTATPRSFVRIEYDWDTGNISLATLDYETMKYVWGQPVPVNPQPSFATTAPMFIGSTDMVGLPGIGAVFPGEIACLSIYNHTLPEFQSRQVMGACWDMLGGPKATVATQLCTLVPYCSSAPNITNATLEVSVMAAPILGQEFIDGYWTNSSNLFYVCDWDHAFANYTIVDMNVTCDWGRWKMPFPYCGESPLQRFPLTLEIVPTLSNPALLKYFYHIEDIILITSWRIANISDYGNLTTYATIAAEQIAQSYQRFFDIAENLTSTQILSMSKTVGAALSNLLYASTNSSQTESGVSLLVERAANCSDEYYNSLSTTTPSPGGTFHLSEEDLRKQYALFAQTIILLSKLVRRNLEAGTEFSMDERFFAARIHKIKLSEIPGLYINCTLATVQFPSNPHLIVESAYLDPDLLVSVVVVAFLDNVYDINKPFNIPTISIRAYTADELRELTLNTTSTLDITAVPIKAKSLMYANEKINVQCDVSNITCDLETNADLLGSLVRFPVLVSAGNFFLDFPPNPMTYNAYIAINFLPNPTNYTWRVKVKYNGEVTFYQGNPSVPVPPHIFNGIIGLRVVVHSSIIHQYVEWTTALNDSLISGNETINETSSSDSRVFLNVYMKKDTSMYSSTDSLPAELCELQHCYGYHLLLDTASDGGSSYNITRSKRDVSSSYMNANDTDDDLLLQPQSTEGAIKFKSSYFGDLGADLVITPNTIEFSDIFSRFTTLLADNYAVLAFMALCIVLFLVGVVITNHYDKRDIRSWGYLPIISNKPCEKISYYVSVHYHSVQSFNLRPRIFIRFIGDLCDMPFRRLKDGVRKNFTGSHPANFLVTTHHSIGTIDKIELRVTSKKWGLKPFSMYIDKVLIVDAHGGKKFLYPVKKRMSAGDSRTVTLASEDDVKSFRYLVSGHARGGITEAHPWLSIAKRPLPSNWTRVERLGCVVSALFMAMLVNAMFYGKEAAAPRVGIQVGKFFRISWFTIWTAIVGSVIILPPTAIMAFIFKKIRRRSAEQDETKTSFNIAQDVTTLPDEDEMEDIVAERDRQHEGGDLLELVQKKKKKRFQLPFWCVAIAWFLVAACIGCSAFVVVLYSLAWGRDKSLQWLSGIIIHMVQDIIIIQTFKVMIMSIVSSTLLKLPDDGLQVGRLTFHPNNKKSQTELFARMRNVIAGIAHHILYVIVFSLVINTTQNPYAYQQVKDVKSLVNVNNVAPIDGTINDYATIYGWLSKKVVQNFYSGSTLHQGLNFKRSKIYSIKNHDVAIIGPIRLRQQRVSSAPCQLEASITSGYKTRFSSVLGANGTRCQESYSSAGLDIGTNSERRTFNESWELVVDTENVPVYLRNATFDLQQSPWSYRSADGPPFSGWQAKYESGGYYVDLPQNLSASKIIINELMLARWLDNSTSVFIVEFTLFNAQLNLFIPVKIVFEALDAGGMVYHTRVFPLQLYQYIGSKAMLVLGIQALWIFLTLSHIFKIGRMIKKDGYKNFAKDGWNLFDCAHILLGLGLIGLFAVRIAVIMSTVSDMKSFQSKFVNLDLLASWEDIMFCLYGIAFFMALLLFFRNLSFNKYWAIFLGTLAKAKSDLVSFIVVFALITCMFATLGYCSLGMQYPQYQSFVTALMTLIQNIIGVNGDFMTIATSSGGFVKLFCLSYSFIVLFLAVQFFMSIVNVTYGVVANNAVRDTKWDSALSEYISEGINELVTKKKEDEAIDDETKDDILSPDDIKLELEPGSNAGLTKLDRIVGRLDRIIEKADATADGWGKGDRNLVSWLALLLRQQRNPNSPPPAVSFAPKSARHSSRAAVTPQPSNEQPSRGLYRQPSAPHISQSHSQLRKMSSVAMRNDYWQYLNTPEADMTLSKNEALRQLQETSPEFVIDIETGSAPIVTTSATIRRVYSSQSGRSSIDPITPNNL